jgi:GT2 family glycosyltransferase
MQINAIVVNYFTADFILLLVDILLREPEMGLVVIADNSGEDAIVTLAKKDNRIKVMRFGKNIGFGAAVNRAAQAYPADWFLVINPDTVPDAGFLQQLLQGALQTNALIAGPRFFWDDNKLFKLPPALGHSWSIQYNMAIAKQSAVDATLLDAQWTIRHERFWKTETPFTESFLSGACLLIKNDTSYFQGGNLFDPRFFMYYEDTDICINAVLAGKTVVCIPGAHVVHYWNQSPTEHKATYMGEAHQQYMEKYYGTDVGSTGFHQSDSGRSQVPSIVITDCGCVTTSPTFAVDPSIGGELTFELGLSPLMIPFIAVELSASPFVIPEKVWERMQPGTYYGRIRNRFHQTLATWKWEKRSAGTTLDLPHPIPFQRYLFGGDMFHVGYWPAGSEMFTLEQAQAAAFLLLVEQLPPPPSRILHIGCSLGAISASLAKKGYDVVAIATDSTSLEYAQEVYPGPTYLIGGFLEEHPLLQPPECYDIVLLHESLQQFSDHHRLFTKIKTLLRDDLSTILLFHEATYTHQIDQPSAVKAVAEVYQSFSALGYYVEYNRKIGKAVLPTFLELVRRVEENPSQVMDIFPFDHVALDEYVAVMQRQADAYQTGTRGFEITKLRQSDVCIRTYQEGDESFILPAFNRTFDINRSMAHWQWKFKQQPYGGPIVSTAWKAGILAGQYTTYPLTLSIGANRNVLVQHAGDTFIVPTYRDIGRGKNGLLTRVFRLIERVYFEQKVYFIYGFCTGHIRRLGQLFLGYVADKPVFMWQLSVAHIQKYRKANSLFTNLGGYQVSRHEKVGDWADQVFDHVRKDYPWLTLRDKSYLRWRYEQHPDFQYFFYLTKHWGKPVGWWLVRQDGDQLSIGDALFGRDTATKAMAAGLSRMLQDLPEIQHAEGWFSETPVWWNEILRTAGFVKTREVNNLYLCIVPYSGEIKPVDIEEHFYFTWGDSDLF